MNRVSCVLQCCLLKLACNERGLRKEVGGMKGTLGCKQWPQEPRTDPDHIKKHPHHKHAYMPKPLVSDQGRKPSINGWPAVLFFDTFPSDLCACWASNKVILCMFWDIQCCMPKRSMFSPLPNVLEKTFNSYLNLRPPRCMTGSDNVANRDLPFLQRPTIITIVCRHSVLFSVVTLFFSSQLALWSWNFNYCFINNLQKSEMSDWQKVQIPQLGAKILNFSYYTKSCCVVYWWISLVSFLLRIIPIFFLNDMAILIKLLQKYLELFQMFKLLKD